MIRQTYGKTTEYVKGEEHEIPLGDYVNFHFGNNPVDEKIEISFEDHDDWQCIQIRGGNGIEIKPLADNTILVRLRKSF